ncbi:unnamed protein product, partial [Rotaria socialis]
FVFIESIDDSSGPQWKQAVVNIGRHTQRFVIEIDGSPDVNNAIGIDDIDFYNCQAGSPPELG